MLELVCPLCGEIAGSPLARTPEYTLCSCGLIRRLGPITPTYEDGYFTVNDVDAGMRDFSSDWALAYDRARFSKELDQLGPPRGRLCDVGAATGVFVRMARARGWDAVGVEPSSEARAIALRYETELLSDIAELQGSDPVRVLTMHHVLEHLPAPVEQLRQLTSVMASDSLLLVEVPCWRSIERRVSGATWVDLRPEQHLWHFTPTTLRRVLQEAGFETLETWTLGEPIPTVRSVLSSVGVVVGPRSGEVIDTTRLTPALTDERSKGFREGLARYSSAAVDKLLNAFQLGRRLVATAQPRSGTDVRS